MRVPRFHAIVLVGFAFAGALGLCLAEGGERPNVLVVTIDTLRADRLSGYGYERTTSPNLDRLMRSGARFSEARTVEPLTGPALSSMLTSSFPHEHGASRNGLRLRKGLPSLPKLLADRGYVTAAMVSNWTLRDKVSGLAEHFDEYNEVLRRKRWLGLVSSEAGADDVTEMTLNWLELHADTGRPFFLWVHYVEPHAPYKKQRAHLDQLGLKKKGKLPPSDRYDTEIAYADRSVAELLDGVDELGLADSTLIAFTSDHGESLGEHQYWGHGRHLFEATLHIPMALVWPGRIKPQVIEAPALNIDLAPTIAGLFELDTPGDFRGFDWTEVLAGSDPPMDRATQHQAHRGAVLSKHDSDVARRSGLLEVAVVHRGMKEILRVKNGRRWRFDLGADPLEERNLVEHRSPPTDGLRVWMDFVDNGLRRSDTTPPAPLDDETIEQLRALGYAD